MIIGRYITHEIAKPLSIGCVILALIYASYRSAVNLTDAAGGLLQPEEALKLILLETLIALEVLLPTGLYVAVLVGLTRMHKDYEIAALRATGIGENKLIGAVLRFSVVIALIVAALSMFVRPWAYQTSHAIEAQGIAEADITSLDAERFYELKPTTNILFAEKIDRKAHRMRQVFVQGDQADQNVIIYAQEAYRLVPESKQDRSMVFLDGRVYELSRNDTQDRIFKFRSLTVRIKENVAIDIRDSRKAESTASLFHSDNPRDIAEFQWRLSTPVATVLLALLAVPLSRSSPRQGRHTGFVTATLVYALFFNLAGVAKTWVEQGFVGAVPGLWWVYALPAVFLLLLLRAPDWVLGARRN